MPSVPAPSCNLQMTWNKQVWCQLYDILQIGINPLWILYPLLVFISCSNLHCEPAWGHSKPDQASVLYFFEAYVQQISRQTTGSKLSVPSLELDQVHLFWILIAPSVSGISVEFWLLLHHDIKLLQGLAICTWEVGSNQRIVNNDLLKLITLMTVWIESAFKCAAAFVFAILFWTWSSDHRSCFVY